MAPECAHRARNAVLSDGAAGRRRSMSVGGVGKIPFRHSAGFVRRVSS